MLKSGILKVKDMTYSVVQYDGAGFLRFDIFTNMEDYGIYNTERCNASYYKERVVRLLGENKLIKLYKTIINAPSIINAVPKREVTFEDGKPIIVVTKEDSSIDAKHVMKLVGVKVVYEYFQTKEGSIEFTAIEQTKYTTLVPYNIDDYETLGFEDKVQVKKKPIGRNYKTAEELLREFPALNHINDGSNDYVVAQSYEEAVDRLNIWINSKEQLKSVDIESYHTLWGIGSDNRITGVFLGFGEKWSTYFPFRQENFPYNLPLEFLRQIVDGVNNQPPAPEVLILSHNSKFEIEGFYQEFTDWIRIDVDTWLLAILVNPIVKSGTHTLKAIAAKVDGNFYVDLKHIFYGKVEFNVLPPDVVRLYGCPDATSPAKIFPYLMKKLPADERYIMSLEMKLPYVKASMEFYGLRLKQDKLDAYIQEQEEAIEILSTEFKRIFHTSKNINSTDVLRDIMYNKLRLPVEVTTDKGLPAVSRAARKSAIDKGTIRDYDKTNMPKPITDKSGKVLIKSEELASNKYYSLVIYEAYKKAVKELGALRRLKKKSLMDRFRFYINQLGAGSSRETSDAQQFSDIMKSLAVADSEHHGMLSSDWSQVELRIFAWVADEKPLLKLCHEPGVDLHRAILSLILGKEIWDISEEERKNGKAVNFGAVYLISEYGLVRMKVGPKYTKAELIVARDELTTFFNTFPMINKLIAETRNRLLTKYNVKTLFNYYRYFPELADPTLPKRVRESMIRAGTNTPIQGTGAGMIKIAQIKCWNYIRDKGWDKPKMYDGIPLPQVRIMLSIHDELLVSYDKEIPKEEIIHMMKECMELEWEGAPPFFACPAFINNWADGKNPAFEIGTELRDKIDAEFLKGNYLLRDSGKEYLDYLTEYRKQEVESYMQELKAKYKTVDAIAENVKHPSLTHTLIEAMLPEKSDRKHLSHRERIKESVRKWMYGQEATVTAEYKEVEEEKPSEELIALEDWESAYITFDDNGDVVYEAKEGYEDEEEAHSSKDDLGLSEENLKPVRLFYIGLDCVVDFTGLNIKEEGQWCYEKLLKLCDNDGGYNLKIMQGNKMRDTRAKIPYVPNKINEIFEHIDEYVKE